MAQRKRNSNALSKAERRKEGLRGIDPDLDLGNGLSVTKYETMIDEVREKLAAYNVAQATAGVAQNTLLDAERQLSAYSAQLLSAIAAIYGRDSDEYEMAGGTRLSDRKRPARRRVQSEAAMARSA